MDEVTKDAYDLIREAYTTTRSKDDADVGYDEDEPSSEKTDFNDHLKVTNPAKRSMTIEERIRSKPHVIYGDEFGEETEAAETYDTISLYWFTDEILADEDTMEIVDIASSIGWGAIDEFDKQRVTTIYIRNDRLKCDYEVFKYDGSYQDYIKERPYLDKEL